MMRTIKSITFVIASLISLNAYSQTTATAVKASNSLSANPLFIAMGVLTAVLLLVIVILSGVLRTAVKTRIREIMNSKGIKTLSVFLLLFASADMMAQETAARSSLYESAPIAGMHPAGFYSLFVVMLLELFVILWLCLLILRIIVKKEAAAAEVVAETVKEPSFLNRIVLQKLLGVTPVEQEKDLLMDHDYDGIKELDNDLPPWWKYGFYLTILSGVIYMISYHVTHTSKSSLEEYNEEMAQAEASVSAYRTKMALNVDESNAVFVTEPDKLENGKSIYLKNCSVCHGNEGQGLVGPNFADKHWIYGDKPGDMFKVVKNGANNGMKAWKDELSPVEMQNVIAYIHTFLGTNPPNPKEPQGVLVEDNAEATAAPADSAKSIEVKS